MNANRPRRVLAIALDSAEPTLVEKWMNTGILPNLKRLRLMGGYGRLKSSAEWLAGSPWPTFYTGTGPAEHGLYETKQWHPERMTHVQTSQEWLPLHPFWRELGENGLRVVSVDLPMTYPPERFNGIEICGWMTYDSIGNNGKTISYPPTEVDHLRDEFGLQPTLINYDKWGVQTVKSLLRMRDQLIQATENISELAKTLMTREKWDLFMVAFASTHRGGHKLWDFSGTIGRASARDRREFSHALRDVYVACDKAIGRLTEAAGGGANLLVFSLHGMQANTDRTSLLPRMLNSVLGDRSRHTRQNDASNSSLAKMRERGAMWMPLAFPISSWAWKAARTLYHVQDPRQKPHKVDAPAISLLSCLNGYIRINLRGREKNGIVEPGETYDRLCSALIEDLRTFVDADTREPIVEQIMRTDEVFPSGPRSQFLPDLIMKWASAPAVYSRKVVSDRYPWLSIPMPPRNISGRSGNHSPEGFMLAVGSGIPSNILIEKGNILDLAPTILGMLGVDKPIRMRGISLYAKTKGKTAVSR